MILLNSQLYTNSISNMNIFNKISFNIQPVRPAGLRRLRAACDRCIRAALDRLDAVKVKVECEFGQTMAGCHHLLKAALNEAEALAWQTPYPHLLFPLLAQEKAAEAQKWAIQQRTIRERTSPGPPRLELAA
jgi:hypothetical protein